MTQRILIVCLGNICRSPMAEGVLRSVLADQNVQIDSAGTSDWHVGDPPDPRAIAAAGARGYDIRDQRARQLNATDFSEFDVILAMDRKNLADITALRPANASAQVAPFLTHCGLADPSEVPDPWYSGDYNGVLDLIETAVHSLKSQMT